MSCAALLRVFAPGAAACLLCGLPSPVHDAAPPGRLSAARPASLAATAGEIDSLALVVKTAFTAAKASCASVAVSNVGECASREEDDLPDERAAVKAAQRAIEAREAFIARCLKTHKRPACVELLSRAVSRS